MGKGFDVNPDGQIVWHGSTIVTYLAAAGLLAYLTPEYCDDNSASGVAHPSIVEHLAKDHRFAQGSWLSTRLHPEVGTPRVEFRSHRGELRPELKRSIQVVVNTVTGRFHADTDMANPLSDVAGFLGHAFGEVIPHWLRKKPRSDRA